MGGIEAWGKRKLLACSKNAEGCINCHKLSKTCHHTQVDSFVNSWGCTRSREAIEDRWLVDYSTVSAFGAYAIATKMQGAKVGTMEQSMRQARGQVRYGYFCAASITESGLSYKLGIVICHIKEITAILYHSLPVPEKILMLITSFGHTLKLVINMLVFVYHLHLSYDK